LLPIHNAKIARCSRSATGCFADTAIRRRFGPLRGMLIAFVILNRILG
jgi:hypothetical protein